MKSVGMITFHESNSLGANLQAFALQTMIEREGFEVEIINFDRKGSKQEIAVARSIKYQFIILASKIHTLLRKNDLFLKEKKIKLFKDSLLHISTKRYHSFNELKDDPPLYNFYVTGSDQVWNPYTGNISAYLLAFISDDTKKIAYAPSIGAKIIEHEYAHVFIENVKNFKAISCREEAGANAISQVIERDVSTVLDPTLLLTPDDWDLYANEIQLPKEPYLLCYFLGSLKSSRKKATHIANQLNLKIIAIEGSPADLLWKVKKQTNVGPREFLFLVKNASYICTDSFHGTVFSINFGKPFLCFHRRGYDNPKSYASRLDNILNLLYLNDCLVTEKLDVDKIDINAAKRKNTNTQKRLDELRERSLKFLHEALTN